MTKQDYLKALKEKLESQNVEQSEINDVIEDYTQMYDDALDRGLTDDEVIKLLGEPEQVTHELKDTLHRIFKKNPDNKIVALTPFIALILFMSIGLTTSIWHPTWMVFLLIPVTAIIINTKGFEKYVALSPFIALIAFMLLGTYKNLWDPAWMIFFLIPILGLFAEKNSIKKWIELSALLIAIGFYYYMGYLQNEHFIGALGFALPILVFIYYGSIKITVTLKDPMQRKPGIIMLSTIVLSTAAFVVLGYFFNGWGYAWMFFLLIPMVAIYAFEKDRKLTPFMPFIALIIFYSLGFFFGLWALSWLAFLLIPMVAIFENA